MNFRDQQLTCSECGKRFIFTVTEQRELHESGKDIVPPTRCKDCRVFDPETGRLLGQVKWFSHEKGYGFIVKPSGDEIFVHRSQVAPGSLGALQEGSPVSFKEVERERGPEAQEVEVTSL